MPSDIAVHPGSSQSLTTRLLFAVAVLGTCGLIMAMDYADPDLWGHVLYGQEILEDGSLPTTTTWSFTANEYRWINHENIAELVMALATNWFGPLGLTIGKYLFGWALLGLIWWRARANDVSQFVAAFVCFIIAISVQFHWHFRPQIFGYVFFGIMCALLFWSFQRGPNASEDSPSRLDKFKRLKHLFWLAPLAAIWTNTHGSFAAGICIAIAYMGLEFIRIFLTEVWKKPKSAPETIAARRALVLLPIIALTMSLATFANPYGVELHQWLLEALRESRPEIVDWESPSLFSGSREVIGLWVMLITTLIAFKTAPQKDWSRLIVFLLTASQAVSHIRHLPLLAILWGSWFAVDINRYVQQFVNELRSKSIENSVPATSVIKGKLHRRAFITQIILFTWIIGVGSSTWSKLSTLNVPREMYPVDALKFMADHRLEGRTVVTFNWAQYAIGFFVNERLNSTVAFDGRFRTCYPQEVIDIYFDFIFGENYQGPRNRSPHSGPVNSSLALSYKDPEVFLISRKQKSSVRTMEDHQDGWVLLYEDELAQIWGKRTRFDNPDHVDFLASSNRQIGTSQTKAAAAWPAFASQSSGSSSNARVVAKD